MSDIEDGELLSSDNEDSVQPLSQKEEQKPKNKVKNYVDPNNNLQTFVNDHRNFHKNDENYRYNKKKDSNSPNSHDRKRKHYNKVDLTENKKHRKSNENKEKEYSCPKNIEILTDLSVDNQKIEENSQIKRKILCKYYASGECKNGPNCVFMHEDFPCKFFHDKTTSCRAGDDCKYSHAPLADDMKTIMDSFIQDGKDHKTNFNAINHSANVPVHNRTKCLLPTPVEPQISQLSQTQFHKPVFYSDFCDPEPYEEPLINNTNNFINRYANSSLRTSYPINQARLIDQDFRQKPLLGNFSRIQPDFNNKINFMSFDSNGKSYIENYRNDFFATNLAPASPPENIFHEPSPCDINIIHNTQNISYNNHAPARFIIGSNNNASKPIVESNLDDAFKEALRKLADTVTLPDILSSRDNIQNSNSEDQENIFEVKQEKNDICSTSHEKNPSIKQAKFKCYTSKDKNGYKSNFITVPPGKPLQSTKKPELIRKSSIYEGKPNFNSVKQEHIDYDPIQPHENQCSQVISNIIQEKVSYSPVQPNSNQVSYSPFIQEKVTYSPVLSNIKQETVSYSPVQSSHHKVSYSPINSNFNLDTSPYSLVQHDKPPVSPVQTENDNNNFRPESVPNNVVRIADNVSIFNINENELSDSEKQYIEEMRSLINLNAQFENRIPWVAHKLEPILKQPYILFSFKFNQVHENAASDPRMVGHPILREIESLNDPDEMSTVKMSISKNNSFAHIDESGNDDYEDENDHCGGGHDYLKIDLKSSNPSASACDTHSYVYNYKVKKENVSGQIIL